MKSITITKERGERWDFKFDGEVNRRDLNKIMRLLPKRFNLRNRKRRIEKLKDERLIREKQEQPKLTKEERTAKDLEAARKLDKKTASPQDTKE